MLPPTTVICPKCGRLYAAGTVYRPGIGFVSAFCGVCLVKCRAASDGERKVPIVVVTKGV